MQTTRDSQVWGSIKERSLSAQKRRLYTSEHKGILLALRNRDAATVEAAMRKHLIGVAQTIQASLEPN